MKITGIVLSGGKSSRMGTDKCLLKLHNKTFVEIQTDILSKVCNQILISANNTDKYNFLNYSIVKDEFHNCGPISGIYSSLKKAENLFSLIISCDTPNLNIDFLNYLISNIGDFDAIVPIFNNKTYPTTAIYSKNCLKIIEQSIKNKNYKLINLLEKLNTKFLEINKDEMFYNNLLFANINTVEDYKNIIK